MRTQAFQEAEDIIALKSVRGPIRFCYDPGLITLYLDMPLWLKRITSALHAEIRGALPRGGT